MVTKPCGRCKEDLPLDSYAPAARTLAGSYCRTCRRKYQKQWKADHPTYHREYKRKWYNSRRGLPPHPVLIMRIKVKHYPKPKRAPATNYRAVHARIARIRGKAADHPCQHCDQPAATWAYDHTDPTELTQWILAGKTSSRAGAMRLVRYSLDLTHYLALCRSCHGHMDQGNGRSQIAAWDPPPMRFSSW